MVENGAIVARESSIVRLYVDAGRSREEPGDVVAILSQLIRRRFVCPYPFRHAKLSNCGG